MQYYFTLLLFYCIFDLINAASVRIKDFIKTDPKLLNNRVCYHFFHNAKLRWGRR